MNVQWWCAAGTGPWTWEPQAYPGVWLFQLLLLGGWVWALRRLGPRHTAPGEPAATRGQVAYFVAGWALLWAVLDWPLGALAAGYLLTAHMVQYVAMVLVIVPLLENGVPPWLHRAMLAPRPLAPVRALVERPFAAFLFLNVVMVVTHIPLVADTLKPLQFGSLAIDMLWLGSAWVFWRSIAAEGEREALPALYGRRLLFVIGIKVLPIFVGAFFVLSEFPIYRTYELAARAIEGLSASGDQTIAGWLVWMGATPLLLVRLATAFFAWHALEERRAGQV